MREKQSAASTTKTNPAKSPIRLAVTIGLFIVLLALVAGGGWWLAGKTEPVNQYPGINGGAAFPGASMPSCLDRPARDCVLSVNPSDEKLMAQYGQPLGQTQTLGDITLRLDQVYADNNYILVAYTLFQPFGFSLYPGNSTLALENQPLLNNRGTSMAGGNDHAIAIIEAFDTSTLAQTAGEIKLRFEIPGITSEKIPPTPLPSQVTPPATPPRGFIPAQPTSTIAPADTVTAEAGTGPDSTQITTGPFSLEFTARLTPARILEPKQAVKAAAGTATLEKIVITPLTERLFFSGVPQETDLRVELVAANAVYTPGPAPNIQHFCGVGANNLVSCDFETGTFEKLSEWQIVLRRGVDVPVPTPQPCPECAPPPLPPTPLYSPTTVVPSGPWIFRLKL